jgi:hypothetical protein
MNSYDVSFQLVDSPTDQRKSAGSVDADGLVPEFRKFPFADEVKRAETLKGDITFPTLIFKRQSDGEEISIWTDNGTWFDLCLVHDSTKSYLSHQTKKEAESILSRFQTESVLDIQPARPGFDDREEEAVRPGTESVVIYDGRVRWVAAINLAFAVAGIYFAMRFVPGMGRYVAVVFLSLFSLFWIKDFLFGFRIRLVSDGQLLTWQEKNQTGTVAMKNVTKILVGVGRPQTRSMPLQTCIRFAQADGREKSLPPNIANGLRAGNWRRLRQLIAHIRTITPVVVEPFDDPDLNIEGWTDEQGAEGTGPKPVS